MEFELLEKIKNKFEERTNFLFYKLRRKRLKNLDFTIISNNCWSGKVYRYFGLRYNTPTVGLYFFQKDYIKFTSNLKYYVNLELKFIEINDSKYKNNLIQKNEINIPIGVLGDIEIVFLHYKTKEEALEKWNKRCKRINWNNIIIKNSSMNGFEDCHVEDFKKIKKVKKIMFLNKKNKCNEKYFIYFPSKCVELKNDTNNWRKFIDIYKLINTDYYI